MLWVVGVKLMYILPSPNVGSPMGLLLLLVSSDGILSVLYSCRIINADIRVHYVVSSFAASSEYIMFFQVASCHSLFVHWGHVTSLF